MSSLNTYSRSNWELWGWWERAVYLLCIYNFYMYSKIYGQMVSDDTATVYYFPSRILSSRMGVKLGIPRKFSYLSLTRNSAIPRGILLKFLVMT